MRITSIRIKKNNNPENKVLLGVASIEFDNCLVIHDLQLIQLQDKRIVSFPHKKAKKYILKEDGYDQNYEYTDIVHPSNKEFRNYVETELFKIYDSEVKEEK
jgi:DNA-binding cell septation regulator SpoVG